MRHTIPFQPVSADISRALNEFGKGSGLHDVAVCPVGLAASEVMLVVRGGEDDDRDCRKPRIGPKPLQDVASVLVAEVEVEKNQGGERVACLVSFAR